MGWWTDHVVPRMTDAALSAPEIEALRAQVCAPLGGRVIEVGFGSGLNLPHLPDAVTAVDAVEPSDLGWSRSADRRRAAAIPVTRVGLDGQTLDARDASYDAALVTFSLCTIPDPTLALAEVRRVLRPGGTLAFLEHGLHPADSVARWQRRLDPLERTVAGGCHLSRDVPALVRDASFRITDLEERMLQAAPAFARPWAYVFVGRATS